MKLSSESNWSPLDFLVPGTLFFALGINIDQIFSMKAHKGERIDPVVDTSMVFLNLRADLARRCSCQLNLKF